MDYNGLIEQLRNAFPVDGYELERSVCESAADAIETLLAERDALMRDKAVGVCKGCKNLTLQCFQATGKCRGYTPRRGPQKEPTS